MRLSLVAFTDRTLKTQLGNWSRVAQRLVFTTGPHGPEALTCTLPLVLRDAFELYDMRGLPHVGVMYAGAPVWIGRLEDIAVTETGVNITALGYWSAFQDLIYTASWSRRGIAGWRTLTPLDYSAEYLPERFEINLERNIYIAPRKNEMFGSSPSVIRGVVGFLGPVGMYRYYQQVTFDYEYNLPSGWQIRVEPRGRDWSVGTAAWTVTSAGTGLNTGSATGSLPSGCEGVSVTLLDTFGGTHQFTGETGSAYMRITNMRVKAVTTSVTADLIVAELWQYLMAVNADQTILDLTQIKNPGADLWNEEYVRMTPADILMHLAALGNTASPPQRFEVGVDLNRKLYFRPEYSAGNTWYVDATSLEITRTLQNVKNAVYAAYQDFDGQALQTALAVDAESVTKYGVRRDLALEVQTTSTTNATTQRDLTLADTKAPKPQAAVRFQRIFDAYGAEVPGWNVQAGDLLVIRNLPPGVLGNTADRIRSFRIANTSYDVDARTLEVTPATPPPYIEWMLARKATGVPVEPIGLIPG